MDKARQDVERRFDTAAIAEMVNGLAGDIAKDISDGEQLCLVGIRRLGDDIARRLAVHLGELLGRIPEVGVIDITLYRDDWTKAAATPTIGLTDISFPIDGRQLVLVDDVLYTGRTVRAALDQLMDFGRPRAVRLAVLIDRGGRELPIQADYTGAVLTGQADRAVQVRLTEAGAPEDEVVLVGTSSR